jgi:hypothetical protein
VATSGTYNFLVTRNEIIEEALRHLGVIGEGETPSANQYTEHAKTLNMMIKALVPRGLSVWATERLTIFLEDGKASYVNGDKIALSDTVVRTELTADAASSATSITVDSITGIEDTDQIGIELDDGSFHWTTVSGAPSGSTITLASGLASAASVGNVVYSYATAIVDYQIKELLQAWLRNKDEHDIPMNIISRAEYWDLGNKSDEGAPNQIFFSKEDGKNPLFYIYPLPDDLTYTVEVVVRKNVKNFDSSTDNPDFPQEWFEALSLGLAWRLSNMYGKSIAERQYLGAMAESALQHALSYDKEENTSIYFAPDRRFM